MEPTFTSHDLQMSEEIGQIKALVKNINHTLHAHIEHNERFWTMFQSKQEEIQSRMQAELDAHGKSLSFIKGVGTVLQILWGSLLVMLGFK